MSSALGVLLAIGAGYVALEQRAELQLNPLVMQGKIAPATASRTFREAGRGGRTSP